MRRHVLAAAAVLPLLAAGCTNGGVDPNGLQPLTSEQARSVAPPPPGTMVDIPAQPTPGVEQADLGTPPLAAPPPSPVPAPMAQAAAVPMAQAQQPAVQPQQAAAVKTQARIEFAPVVGADAAKLQPLATRLAARAAQRGIAIAGGAGAPTHVLKGYFSAFTDNRETTIIYVWDVLDPAGNRLHRIQGQQKVPEAKGQGGWNAVTPAIMEAIADRTIDDLAVWLAGATG